MRKFILGFVMAIISIIVGALIFVGKLVCRGSKTMPWTTKRYIKDQFTFVDISKVKNAIANSIKAFVDWMFFAKETSHLTSTAYRGVDTFYYDNKPAYKAYRSCKSYKTKTKTKTAEPIPYFIDEDECGCEYYTMELMYDISTGKLYDDYDEEVMSYDFIKDMIKAEDTCVMEPGNYIYIHDPRDDTDYSIAIEDLSQDEGKENVDDESKEE